MLGLYKDFPRNVHRAETFSASISAKRLQHVLVETLGRLNRENPWLEDVFKPSVLGCDVVFEVGVAEGSDFNYLDNEEERKLVAALDRKTLQVMDFLFVIRYQKKQENRRTRMRFDYYMLRVVFGRGLVELLVFHERGLMRISPEDLVRLVVNRVNSTFPKRALRPSEPSERA